jgi:hypothetical protein
MNETAFFISCKNIIFFIKTIQSLLLPNFSKLFKKYKSFFWQQTHLEFWFPLNTFFCANSKLSIQNLIYEYWSFLCPINLVVMASNICERDHPSRLAHSRNWLKNKMLFGWIRRVFLLETFGLSFRSRVYFHFESFKDHNTQWTS